MAKVNLTLVSEPYSDNPGLVRDTKRFTIEIDKNDVAARIMAIGLDEPQVSDQAYTGPVVPSAYPSYTAVIYSEDVDRLVGKLLTYIEATYQDPEQRKAHKAILRQTIWGWSDDLNKRSRDYLGIR